MTAFLVALAWLQLSTAAGQTTEWSLTVDGITRNALVVLPAHAIQQESKASLNAAAESSKHSGPRTIPVVFAFHGHGGNARNAQRTFQIEKHWPESLVVYMQGIPTPGQLTDPEGKKNGWQSARGDQGDRDLKFFDAVYERLVQEFPIAKDKVFATGHSNGGGFSYLLWSTRGDRFAAFAPCASVAGRKIPSFEPKPVLHLAGTNDPLVKYEWQNLSIARLVRNNQCETESYKPADAAWSVYRSAKAPVFTYIHEGTHTFPSEAPKIIVQFFQSEPWKSKDHRKE